jgi:hypothetical protein
MGGKFYQRGTYTFKNEFGLVKEDPYFAASGSVGFILNQKDHTRLHRLSYD